MGSWVCILLWDSPGWLHELHKITEAGDASGRFSTDLKQGQLQEVAYSQGQLDFECHQGQRLGQAGKRVSVFCHP